MKHSSNSDTLTVLYDGGCPLCLREIAHVKGLAERTNSALEFVDVSDGAMGCAIYANDREKLLARFHVQRSDGSRLDGAEAFVAMWSRLPGWRWLARWLGCQAVCGPWKRPIAASFGCVRDCSGSFAGSMRSGVEKGDMEWL